MSGPGTDRKFYLEDMPLEEALSRFLSTCQGAGRAANLSNEFVPLEEALNRVTAVPVWAKKASPHYNAAAMDGAAIRSEDSEDATESAPVRLKIGEQAQWVDTGKPIPAGFNAVVMIEHIQADEGHIEIMSPVAPWQHVRVVGEDIVPFELLLLQGHVIKPVDLGALAQGGVTEVEVRRRPRVAIIPTGSELVMLGTPVGPGDILESNSFVLAGLVKEWGGEPTRFGPVPDEYERLADLFRSAAADYDIIISNAGVSAGRRDFTASLVSDLGRLLVHGVAIRPGHPVVLGLIDNKPFIGTPGYPVSAVLTMDLFAKPLISSLLGVDTPVRRKIQAVITQKVFSPMGDDEFLRIKMGKIGDKFVATPLQRGAGATASLLRSDGLVRVPRGSEGFQAGQLVSVEVLRDLEEIENAIVAIGSHDMSLEVLAKFLRARCPGKTLSSSNVGSMSGLVSLKRDEAHIAGAHLLDEETGEYNIPYVRRMLDGRPVVIVNLVYRDQGLMVAKGNPKNISSLSDLARVDVSFVNRQRGAGTRLLLDYKIREEGLDSSQIDGYDRVEFTHLGVATEVKTGIADTGLGIIVAARALGLDFVPLVRERYDLVVPREYYESEKLRPILDMLHEEDFKSELAALGYHVEDTGRVMAELPD